MRHERVVVPRIDNNRDTTSRGVCCELGQEDHWSWEYTKHFELHLMGRETYSGLGSMPLALLSTQRHM